VTNQTEQAGQTLPEPTPMSEANQTVKAAMAAASASAPDARPKTPQGAVRKTKAAKKAPAKKAPAKKAVVKPAASNSDWKPEKDPELEAHLKVIEDFANQLDKAESTADRDTLTVGEALFKLFNDPDHRWVREYERVKPTTANAAGKKDPRSRARFAGWLKWRAEKRRRSAPAATYCWRLLKAHETASRVDSGNAVKPSTEGQIRPLNWLVQNGHPDDVNEVWAQAVELAKVDKRKAPNVTDVKAALSNYKAKLPKADRARVSTERKAATLRDKAKRAVEVLWAADTFEGAPYALEFHTWYKKYSSENRA
jgi:hypothetical protein